MVHSKRILDVHRGFAFDAATPITRDGKTIFNRFFEPLINTRQESSLGFAPHAFIISDKQVPRRIESEQRHGVESLVTQVRREDAVVCERMAIHLAWRFFRQTTFRGMVETNLHLLIAFVAVESPAKRFSRRNFLCLHFRQTAQQHVDFENGTFISPIRLKESAG